MTTLAYDGRYLAADRQVSRGGDFPAVLEFHTKIRMYKPVNLPAIAVATAGSVIDGELFERWVFAENFAEAPYPLLKENFQGLMVKTIGTGGHALYQFHNDSQGIGEMVGARRAWGGSGNDFAMGVMYHGGTAMEAVDLAQDYCPFTGGGVDYIDLLDPMLTRREYLPTPKDE